jgi:hypothetical protein
MTDLPAAAPPASIPERLLRALAPLAAVALASRHLSDEAWFDEVYTLENFAVGARAFVDYHQPNNHVLFSAALSVWRSIAGESMPALRLLPLAMFAGAVVATGEAFRRIAGESAGLLASLAFATGHAALGHALQLRGYGPSWLPLSLAFLALVCDRERPRAWLLAAAAACLAVAVGILPTNVVPAGVLIAWLGLEAAAGKRSRRDVLRFVVAAAAPATGIVFYLGVLRELASHAAGFSSRWTRAGVLLDWGRATFSDPPFLLLLLLPSLVILARRVRAGDAPARSLLALFFAAAAVPALFVAVSPGVPFPRNLVPLLPLWSGVIAAGLGVAATVLDGGRRRVVGFVALCFLAGGGWREWFREARHPRDVTPHSMYDAYFHWKFHPSRAMEAVKGRAGGSPALALCDGADPLALAFARGPEGPVELRHADTFDAASDLGIIPVFLIVRDAEAAADLHRRLGRKGELRLLEDTGFFLVFDSKR